MEKCEHFTIRGAVAEFRKQDWRLNYPFPIPREPTPEQINSLLPPLDIHRSKWWNCEGCVEDFMEGDRPDQLNGAGPSVAPSDMKQATNIDDFCVDKVNINISVAIDADAHALQPLTCTDANALQLLTCTDVGHAVAEGNTIEQHQVKPEDPKINAICDATGPSLLTKQKPKVMFDLNELPTPEASEPALETDAPETEELISDRNPDFDEITEIQSVHKQFIENTVYSEASPVATDVSPATTELISDNPNCNEIRKLALLDEQLTENTVYSEASPVATDASPATAELMPDNPDCNEIRKPAFVDELRIENTRDSEASPVAADARTGNRNRCPSPEIEKVDSLEDADEDDLIPVGNKNTLRRRKTPKYRTLVELFIEGKGHKSQDVQSDGTIEIVPTPDPPLKKTNLKKKNKGQHSRIQEKHGPKLSDASKDAPRKEVKNRAFDFNLPLEKNNILLDDDNLQPDLKLCGKRKRGDCADQHDTSDTTVVSEPTEMGTAAPLIENGKCLLPRKRRIFGNEVHGVGDAEKFRLGKLDAMKGKHTLKKRQSQNPVAECRKVPTKQSKKSAGEEANERFFRPGRQKKNHCDVSGCVSELRSTDESATIVREEFVLGDRPASARSQDDAPKNEKLPLKRKLTFGEDALKTPTDIEKSCLEKIDTSKRKTANHPANGKIIERGSKEKQNFNEVEEHGTVPPTETEESVGIEADWRIFGAQKKNKNCSDVSGRDEEQKSPDVALHKPAGKQLMFRAEQKKKKKNRVDLSDHACGRGPDERQQTEVRKELGLKDSGIVSPQFTREQEALNGMHLLSMVAAETEDAILPLGPIREEVLVPLHTVAPLNSNVLALGYSGCAQAKIRSEDFLMDEAEDVELLMLGPEDLPLRSHRIIKPIAAEPVTVVKCVDLVARPYMNENTRYQRTNAAGGSHIVQQ